MASAGSSPLRSAPYRRLLAAATVSVLGNAVAPVGLAFAVLDLTGSVSDLGLVVGARSAMNVLFLLAGGVLADRLPPRVVLIGCNTAAAATQAAVAAVVLTRVDSIGLLAALSAVNGAVSAFSQPASAALLPATVDRALLRHATALARISASTALVAGAAAAGVLVAVLGPGWCITADAASFAVAAVVLTGLHLPATPRPPATNPAMNPPVTASVAAAPLLEGRVRRELGRVRAGLGQGWAEFRSRTWLWVVTGSAMAGNAAYVGAVQVLGPQVADHSIGRRLWGMVLACLTVGMVAGGFLAIRIRPATHCGTG